MVFGEYHNACAHAQQWRLGVTNTISQANFRIESFVKSVTVLAETLT